MKQSAHARYEHEEGFRVDMQKLQKVHELTLSRLRSIGGSQEISLKVYRADSTNYTTDDISVLDTEENSQSTRIERIIYTAGDSSSVQINLNFSSDWGIDLRVEGDQRDAVVVLFTDIENLLKHEVARNKSLPQRLTNPLVFIYILWFMMALSANLMEFLPTPGNRLDAEFDRLKKVYDEEKEAWNKETNEIKESNKQIIDNFKTAVQELIDKTRQDPSLENKVDFLFAYRSGVFETNKTTQDYPDPPEYPDREFGNFAIDSLYFILFALVVVVLLHLLKHVVNKYTDSYIFLFGKEVGRQSERIAFRERVVWGVLISFIVGVLGSITASYLLKF